MSKLLQLFIDISLFRAKPQELPISHSLLFVTIAASLATTIPLLMPYLHELGPVLAASLLDIFLLLIFLRGGLYFMEMEERFLQTATALFGTSAVINIPALMLGMFLLGDEIGGINVIGALLRLLMLICSLAVVGNILRYTFNIRFAAGVMIAVIYTVLINILIQQIMPVAA